jgi:PAS domain S-box-containing protein
MELTALLARLALLEQELAAERAKHAFHEQILATVNDAVIVIDTAFLIRKWNVAAERIYGWNADEVLGLRLDTVLRHRYLDGTTDASAIQHMNEHGVWLGRVVQFHRNGHEIWIESTVSYLRDGDGTITGMVSINRDVSARALAEDALRRSEANLRAFFESAPAAHFLLDREYRILDYNRVAAQSIAHAWRREVVVGDSILEYFSDVNRDLFVQAYERCLQGENSRHEVPAIHRPAQIAWYELSFMPVYGSGKQAIIGVAFSSLDVSQRKQTEMRLAQREAQLAGIIDSAMDAIITVDAEQRIVLFNNAAEAVFGVRAAQVLGQRLDRFIPPEVRETHSQHIPAFGRTGITRRSMEAPGVLTAVRDDGTHFPIEATISQMRVEDQPFYTVILRDISERTKLQEQLLQAQKMESIGRLAGGVAHDFNNLLTVIIGGAELASEMLDAEHAAREDLQQVRAAGQRAATLTHQLLAFARRQVLAPRVIDLNTLIQDTEQLLRRLIGEDVHLQTQLTANLAPVRADPHQLQQVLVNLAINARDAMPTGGVLTITTTNAIIEPELAVRYDSISAGPHARVLISDTGIGMDASVRARVFEPFFTTKATGRGTGLGLATSYGIIKQHGGAIWVTSATAKGTTFTIDLPAVDAAVEPVVSQEHNTALPRGHETILLVEDEDSVRAFAERVLQGLGYTVLAASSGTHALGLMQAGTHIELLLTDIVMPGMSGPVLAARMLRQRPELRVVYMSGYAEHASLPTGSRSVVMLQKPFTQLHLAQLVRRILDEPR